MLFVAGSATLYVCLTLTATNHTLLRKRPTGAA